eukprot:scpid69431/ scgid20699/ 
MKSVAFTLSFITSHATARNLSGTPGTASSTAVPLVSPERVATRCSLRTTAHRLLSGRAVMAAACWLLRINNSIGSEAKVAFVLGHFAQNTLLLDLQISDLAHHQAEPVNEGSVNMVVLPSTA